MKLPTPDELRNAADELALVRRRPGDPNLGNVVNWLTELADLADLAATRLNLPYEEVPNGPVMVDATAGGGAGPMADHFHARAAIAQAGELGNFAALALDFLAGHRDRPDQRIAAVTLVLPPDTMRDAGNLLRQTAHAAAAAADR